MLYLYKYVPDIHKILNSALYIRLLTAKQYLQFKFIGLYSIYSNANCGGNMKRSYRYKLHAAATHYIDYIACDDQGNPIVVEIIEMKLNCLRCAYTVIWHVMALQGAAKNTYSEHVCT